MNIPFTLELAPTKDPLWIKLRKLWEQLAKVVNGNVEFGDPQSGAVNIRGVWASLTSPVGANTDFTVTHNLGRPSVGYLVMTKDKACDVYTSPTANGSPDTHIILRASVASAALTLFLI